MKTYSNTIAFFQLLATKTIQFYSENRYNKAYLIEKGIDFNEEVEVIEIYIGQKQIKIPGRLHQKIPDILERFDALKRAMENLSFTYPGKTVITVKEQDWRRGLELLNLGLIKC